MVTAARIQQLIYTKGYGIPAQKLGLPFNQFRPSATGPLNPVSGTPIATIDAQFVNGKVAAFNFAKANTQDDAYWYALVDGTLVEVGDYLINPAPGGYSFFIAAMDPLLPILAIRCTRIISLLKPTSATATGINPYGGETKASDVPVLVGWPAWSVRGRGAIRGLTEGKLPGDTTEKNYEFMLPVVTADLYLTDTVTDDLGFTYVINQLEVSPLGLRIAAQQEVT